MKNLFDLRLGIETEENSVLDFTKVENYYKIWLEAQCPECSSWTHVRVEGETTSQAYLSTSTCMLHAVTCLTTQTHHGRAVARA